MRISLSVKMLLLTLGSFLLLIFGIIGSLYLYFNRFYEPEKINQMINSINEFTTELKNNHWSDEQLYTEVSKFMKSQNVTMSIQPQLTVCAKPAEAIKGVTVPDYVVLQKDYPINIITANTIDDVFPDFLYTGPRFTGPNSFPGNDSLSITRTPLAAATAFATVSSATINGSLVLYPASLSLTTASGIGSTVETYEKKGVSYTISTIPYTNYRQVKICLSSP